MSLTELFREASEEVDDAAKEYDAFEQRCLDEIAEICAGFPKRLGAAAEVAKITPETKQLDEYRCIRAQAKIDFGGPRSSATLALSFDFGKPDARVVLYDGRGGELAGFDTVTERDELYAALVKRAKGIVLARLRVP